MLSNSHRVKQRLVRLLFRHKYASKGRSAHHIVVDDASFQDLKKEYLKRLHAIHPDKHSLTFDSLTHKESNRDVSELVDAWSAYEKLEKNVFLKTQNDNCNRMVQSDFIRFGVGCSFADSPKETMMRSEIMDQASQGWFSYGKLTEKISDNDISRSETSSKNTSLIQDDWFIEEEKEEKKEKSQSRPTRKPSLLVDGLFPRRN